MGINIPDSLFNKYNDVVDVMISRFGVKCTLVYPPKRERCGNCITQTMGRRSANVYRPGGPVPFSRGMICPLCGGNGFRDIENTEEITLRVYWRMKDWIDVGFQVDVQDGFIQTIGYMSDLPKINKAKEIIVNKDIQKYETLRFSRASEGFPQGFKQNRFVVCHWKRSG